MCGVAGIVGTQASRQGNSLAKMLEAMRHRGPDATGSVQSRQGNCLLGHARLSIIDLSCNANQPMSSPDEQSHIIYNGECYNFPELKKKLQAEGLSFKTHSDTEVVFEMLRRKGADCLADLNGMFALAYWQEDSQKLILARDRFGQKPIYYGIFDGLFIFASEVRALLASGLVPRRLNRKSLAGYLTFGCTQEPETIIEGVKLLPPGSFIEVSGQGQITKPKRYWDFPRDKKTVDSQELRSEFIKAVDRHMISDVPTGIFLSGGIDSSAIAAAAVHSGRSHVVTLGVAYPEFPDQDESKHAIRVAEHIGSDHRVIPLTINEIKRNLPAYLEHLDQPSVDGFNTYIISLAAKQAGLTVALSGLGGDELFGGYSSNFKINASMLKRNRLLRPMTFLLNALPITNTRIAKATELFSANSYLDYYLARRKVMTKDRLLKLVNSKEYKNIVSPRYQWYQQEMQDREIPDAIGFLEMSQYMGQQLLRDCDVNGMAHSLEIRVPFLDSDFSHLVLKAQSDFREVTNIPKHALVEALRDFLPIENITRPKQGFTIPLANWMHSDLRDTLYDGFETVCNIIPPAISNVFQRDLKKFFDSPGSIRWSQIWTVFILGQYINKENLSV